MELQIEKYIKKELERLKKQLSKAKTVREVNAIRLKIQFLKKRLEELNKF